MSVSREESLSRKVFTFQSEVSSAAAVGGNSSAGGKKKSHQLKSSNRLKPAHKTSISSIQCGSRARPFDGVVIFLQRRRGGG